jgi:colanic acid/amylovoran biosynthesis glycosyltransferase
MGVKAKLVTTFHGNDLSAYIQKNPKAYTRLFANGDLFLPISEQTKQKLQMLGCDPKKTAIHRMGVRMERFEYTPREIIKGEPTTILTIGRLVEKKGHEYAIRAFAKVAATRKGIRYLIVGDGPQRSLLETLAAELGVKDRIEFLGEINQDEAAELYRKSHIFLLPSVTAADGDQEGVPVVLMEAQATGLPVISTKHAGIPEVVEDGKTGYLVEEKDIDALAEKLEYLLEHPEQWPKMGEAGRKLVEEKYDSKKLNKELAGIYIRLLNG